MPNQPRRETPLVAGPAGQIETLIERPESGEDADVLLVCHPHPAHGGALTNKVAYTLARAGVLADMTAVRFNFRGVGKSEGAYDEGRGELADTLAMIDWIRTSMAPQRLMLSGFSFGSAMVVAASHERACDQLILVAPPVGRILDPTTRIPGTLATSVVLGGQDELVDAESALAWCNEQPAGVRVALIETADHFFHGHLPELRELLLAEMRVAESA
ncbi:MAG: alpha/beta fold hydrolase [Pseudomonadota bacterium]